MNSAAVAYSGLIKLHAHEVAKSPRFRRTGHLTGEQRLAIRNDLVSIERAGDFECALDEILDRAEIILEGEHA